jgi:hypothetical protein
MASDIEGNWSGGPRSARKRPHDWWKPYRKTCDELGTTDPIGKGEFDAIVERMLMAARAARD